MITTKLNDATFVIGDKTYSAGSALPLTDAEKVMLARLVELAPVLGDQKTAIMKDCHETSAQYSASLASEFFKFEQDSREFTYTSATLMHSVCSRLGGLLPLAINTEEANSGVFVRQISSPNENVVLTTDIVRKASRFSSLVGDVRYYVASLINPNAIEDTAKQHVTLKAQNWPLMGVPYVKTKTELITLPFDAADAWDAFKWENIESSTFDMALVNALAATLSHESRMAGIDNGSNPFRNITLLIGEKETLGLNLSEVPDNAQRTQLLKREATRVKAKYLISVFFGPLSNEGSTHDFNTSNELPQPYGFMMHVVMRSNKAENLLIGARSWRVEHQQDGTSNLAVHATYEGNIGMTDPKINDVLEHIMSASRAKPVLEPAR